MYVVVLSPPLFPSYILFLYLTYAHTKNARNELACLAMGTIFLVIVIVILIFSPFSKSWLRPCDDEEIAKISSFYRAAEMDFQHLAGPRNVSVNLKYDVLCLRVFMYGIPT